MRLLMVSGDRQVAIGEKGPFHAMLREFSRWFERIDVLVPRPPSEPSVGLVHENVHLHVAPGSRGTMRKWIAARGTELVREHRHALITSHDYGRFYNGLGSWRVSKATGVPYVSELHHVPGHPVAADARERLEKLLARAYVRWARSRALAFRVVNATEMPALLRSWGVPDAKIAVLPSLYVDLELFHPPQPGDEKGHEPAIEQDVVFVGRMVANKGLFALVDALALLAREGRPASALFVGKGPLANDVRKRVERAGLAERVRFVEWVAEPERLADHYRASRVCVCASTCEGGPRFTVEAMACGVPVVSTPVGVMPELLESGERGELSGFDARSIAAALGDVLGDETMRKARGRAAAEEAKRFEYARAIRGYAEGLHRLAGHALPTPLPERPR